MGTGFARHPLVDRINDAFRRDQIAQSANRLANINPNSDALDYLHTLGLFQFDPGVTLDGLIDETTDLGARAPGMRQPGRETMAFRAEIIGHRCSP